MSNTHARDARRIFNYSIRDISVSFTAAYAFFLPPPLPVELPSLLKFLFTPERGEGFELTQVRKSRSHVYRILFFKTSAARLDEIRVAYIIF